MQTKLIKISFTLAATWLLSCGAAQAGSYTFKELKVAGQFGSYAAAVTENDVVVGSVGSHGLIWAQGKYTLVDVPGKVGASFVAVNSKGIVAGQYFDPASLDYQAFTYDLATGAQTLAAMIPNFALSPSGISRTGKIVGFASYPNATFKGFVATTVSNRLLQRFTFATGIDDANEVVGFFAGGEEKGHGFLFHAGTYTLLDVPGASSTSPRFVTPAGVIGGSANVGGIEIGFTLASGVYTTYAFPGAGLTVVSGVSLNGEVVGDYSNPDNSNHGFVFLNGTYYRIDPPGGAFTQITGVNANGTLVGRHTVNNRTSVAFVAECPVDQRPCTQ